MQNAWRASRCPELVPAKEAEVAGTSPKPGRERADPLLAPEDHMSRGVAVAASSSGTVTMTYTSWPLSSFSSVPLWPPESSPETAPASPLPPAVVSVFGLKHVVSSVVPAVVWTGNKGGIIRSAWWGV